MSIVQLRRVSGAADGFALLAAILVIVVVSILSLTGLYIAQNDAAGNSVLRQSMKARYAADAGATQVLVNWDADLYGALDPGDSVDTGWSTLLDGSSVRSVILRADDGSGSPLYRLRTMGRPGSGLTAQRVIIKMVTVGFELSSFCCSSALRGGPNGANIRLRENENLSGLDTIPAEWGGACTNDLEDQPGMVWGDTTDVRVDAPAVLTGDPRLVEDASIDTSTMFNFGDFDYDDLAAEAEQVYVGNQFLTSSDVGPVESPPGTCDTSAQGNWGAPQDPSHPCFNHLPIIHVQGDLRIVDAVGQGILLVDGTPIFEGDFTFYGIVISRGGWIKFRQNATILGGLITRGRWDSRHNTVIRYSQCAVNRAGETASSVLGEPTPLAGRHWFEVAE